MSSVASANLIVTIVVVPVESMVSNVLQLVLTAGVVVAQIPNKLKLKRTKMIWNNFKRAHGYLFEMSYINSYVITFISSECILRTNVGSSTTILSI